MIGLNPACDQSVKNNLSNPVLLPEVEQVLKRGEKSQFLSMQEVIVHCWDPRWPYWVAEILKSFGLIYPDMVTLLQLSPNKINTYVSCGT